ncbi:MAG: lipid-A-disaccharide synthase N-terminal domain-containing protein, partial [Planctomycetota bacterium]
GSACARKTRPDQWVVSEKKRQSVVPEAFWWLSLVGGAALFTYFVWRRDIVGVLGQSTGVVIYARNLRLIHKQRRRERRAALEAERSAEAAAA